MRFKRSSQTEEKTIKTCVSTQDLPIVKKYIKPYITKKSKIKFEKIDTKDSSYK
jgi:hypothetical protein